MTVSVPSTPFTLLARDAFSNLRTLRALERQHQPAWRAVEAQGRRPAYVAAIETGSWLELADAARKELADRQRDLEQMTAVQERVHALEPQLTALGPSADLLGSGVGRRADWPAVRAEVAARLTADGLAANKIEAALVDVEALDDRTLPRKLQTGLRALVARVEAHAAVQLTALSGASLALAVARFNTAAEHPDPRARSDGVAAVETAVDRAERDLWAALRAGELATARAVAEALTVNAAAWLTDTALPLAATETSPDRDPASALRAGDLTRTLLRALALGHQLRWVLSWPPQLEPTRHWLRAAARLPFGPAWSDPERVSVATLAADPDSADGETVTIEGTVEELTISHRGRKAISHARVRDAAGSAVAVVLPYIKLDSGGIVPGAALRVAGTWQAASEEATGPVLRVLRKDFGELAQQSFSDWATGQLRSVHDIVPHGLAASWSWERGTDGAGNALRYGTWHTGQKGRAHARL